MIPEFVKAFLFGKKVTQTFELGISKAVITDNSGKTFVVTREGYSNTCGLGVYIETSKDLLKRYMSDSKRQILIADNGDMVPVCNISSIDIVHQDKTETLTWRK